MSKVCDLTGKRPLVGNNVSHSNRKTKMRQMPNLQKRRLEDPATGKMVTLTLTGRAMRTLKKWMAEGKQVNLSALR
jgi:large subunit ribosomal protein L28